MLSFNKFAAALAVATTLAFPSVSRADVQDEIFRIFDELYQGAQPESFPATLYSPEVLRIFYSGRGFAPAWESYVDIQPVLAELEASTVEGLDPDDYHYSLLRLLETRHSNAAEYTQKHRLRAIFDVLLSDAVLLYARHLLEGKVDPAQVEPTWNFSRMELTPRELAASFQQAVEAGNIVERLEAFKPDVRFYALARAELARYRRLAEAGEPEQIPSNPTLRPGARHGNVPALRRRLAGLGYDVGTAADPLVFDEALTAVVRDFQAMHTLDADGVVGKATYRELNTPLSSRIDQLRLNLDRVRWIQDDVADEMVVVNIAGFELYYFRDGGLAWETDVMVGKIKHQTPIFRHDMTYLEFNPTWTVPRSIIQRSLFSRFAEDPSYVRSHDYKLYDTEGAEVDPASLDWSQYSPQRFPFRVVQQPGPRNALGRVKFMFPNQYAIYLHDTPARTLFARSSRAFSAGCIRVKQPLQFATLLLENEAGWDRDRIDAAVDAGDRQVVRLKEPVDIMLMYWTVSPTADGRIQFHQDIYGKDPESLRLLSRAPTGLSP